MTIGCDLDHLGKRFRARIKTAKGILIGRITFTKTELAFLLGACQVLTDAKEAERLFDPEDQMDVAEMVKCLDVVAKLSEVHEQRFPQAWRSSAGNMV